MSLALESYRNNGQKLQRAKELATQLDNVLLYDLKQYVCGLIIERAKSKNISGFY